jgi:hypothetical protein
MLFTAADGTSTPLLQTKPASSFDERTGWTHPGAWLQGLPDAAAQLMRECADVGGAVAWPGAREPVELTGQIVSGRWKIQPTRVSFAGGEVVREREVLQLKATREGGFKVKP